MKKIKMKKLCSFVVALAHHQYVSSGPHGDAGLYPKYFYNRRIIGKVPLLITGHDHILSDQGNFKGTQVLISGAGGGTRPLETSNHDWAMGKTPGYLTLIFEKDGEKIKATYEFKMSDSNRNPTTVYKNSVYSM